ncbi:MAG: RNase adapter RapZ [Thiotrichales bacterium]
MKIYIVSGLSGSGKTITLNAMEDQGYYCIDNLPVGLLTLVVERLSAQAMLAGKPVALGIDARSGYTELKDFAQVTHQLEGLGHDVKVVYLQADDDELIKRYSETRRKHPLSLTGTPLIDAIHLERELLREVASEADLMIDTTHLNIHELTLLLRDRLFGDNGTVQLSLLLQSFGFKYGVPLDSDFVFDLRCLPNPHWEPKLRPHTGLEQPVQQFLQQHASVSEMYESLLRFLKDWIPQFAECNRSYMTVSIGCTGGRHRSVYMVDQLGQALQTQYRNWIKIKHREL